MNASFMGSQGKPSYGVDVLYLIPALALVVLGAGILSVDALLGI